MSHYVIGLDLGTTTIKAVALDSRNRVMATASSSHSMTSPEAGWAVENLQDIGDGVIKVLKEISSQVPPREIAGICLSGAMHSLCPIDREFSPLAPAMTWADNRSAEIARKLRKDIADDNLLLKVGCPLQNVYHPARLRWWLESEPAIVKKTAYFVSIKDWIIYQLTRKLVIDYGLASTTGLLDIQALEWEKEAFDLSGITPRMMPELVSPEENVGGLTRQVAALTGLLSGIPIIAGTSDGGMANLGSGAVSTGQKIITIGTSGAVRKIVDEPWVDPRGRTWCYIMTRGRWFIGGAINNGGLVLQWVRQKFYSDIPGDEGYSRIDQDVAQITPGAAGLLMLPYLTGERSPYWNPDAFGVILGLGLQHNRGHIARAALEGVAYCIANVWEVIKESSSEGEKPVFLTGVVARNEIWAGILANVLGTTLVRNDVADASAVGAGLLGSLALGYQPSYEKIAVPDRVEIHTSYDPSAHEFYAKMHSKFKQIYQALEE